MDQFSTSPVRWRVATPTGVIAATDGFRRKLFGLAAWCSLLLAALGTVGVFVDTNNRSTAYGLLAGVAVTVVMAGVFVRRDSAYARLRRSPELLILLSVFVMLMFALAGGWRNSLFAATSAPIFFAATVVGVRWAFVIATFCAVAYLAALQLNSFSLAEVENMQRVDLVLANSTAYFFAALLISVPSAWMGRFLSEIHQFIVENSLGGGENGRRITLEIDPDAKRRISQFTSREIEVLQLLAVGLSDSEIASKLGVATKTVQNHLARMRNRSEARSRTELVSLGIRGGLVPVMDGERKARP